MTRSLRIEKVPNSTLLCIKWNGGGEVPRELHGTYTSMKDAKQAIEIWKVTNKREEVVEESVVDEMKPRLTIKHKSLG